jgi:hypothetical protein
MSGPGIDLIITKWHDFVKNAFILQNFLLKIVVVSLISALMEWSAKI